MNLEQIKIALEPYCQQAGFTSVEDCRINKPYWDGDKIVQSTEVWNDFCSEIQHICNTQGISLEDAFAKECSKGGISSYPITRDFIYPGNGTKWELDDFIKFGQEYSKYIKWDTSEEDEIEPDSLGDASLFMGLEHEVTKRTAEILTWAGFPTVAVGYNEVKHNRWESDNMPESIWFTANTLAWEEIAKEKINDLEDDIKYISLEGNSLANPETHKYNYIIELVNKYFPYEDVCSYCDWNIMDDDEKQEFDNNYKSFIEHVNGECSNLILRLTEELKGEIERLKNML